LNGDADKREIFPVDPNQVEVGVGELAIASHPNFLLTPALGSCVGVAIYDLTGKRGGLAHVMLPQPLGDAASMPGGFRFASVAVPELVHRLIDAGAHKNGLQAKIAGGAAMFRGDTALSSIGGRNVAEVRRQLELLAVPLVAEDTGESHARTVELHLDTGVLLVRSYQFGEKKL
jgi:chemotaxis protein CheD